MQNLTTSSFHEMSSLSVFAVKLASVVSIPLTFFEKFPIIHLHEFHAANPSLLFAPRYCTRYISRNLALFLHLLHASASQKCDMWWRCKWKNGICEWGKNKYIYIYIIPSRPSQEPAPRESEVMPVSVKPFKKQIYNWFFH